MDRNFSGSVRRAGTGAWERGELQPLAVGPKQACILANIGMTRLYQLLTAGELDSYWEGRHRKITLESLHRRQQRLLADAQRSARHKS
jgi:hypothetical protein